MRKISLGVWISERDEKLFRYLYENKVAMAKQIQRDIYPEYSLRSINNRLGKMISSDLITATQHRDLGCRLAYSLGQRGFHRSIKPLGRESLRQELGSYAVRHDLDLLEIRKRIETSIGIERYYTENMIAANDLYSQDEYFWFSFVRPDAILEMEIKGRIFRLALEYECPRKYVNRYESLVRNYYHFQIAGILYICSNDALLKRIRCIEAKTIESKDRKFYYSDFSKWKQGQSIVFTNLSSVSIPLKPMTCAYDSVVSPHHHHSESVFQKSLNPEKFMKGEVL